MQRTDWRWPGRSVMILSKNCPSCYLQHSPLLFLCVVLWRNDWCFDLCSDQYFLGLIHIFCICSICSNEAAVHTMLQRTGPLVSLFVPFSGRYWCGRSVNFTCNKTHARDEKVQTMPSMLPWFKMKKDHLWFGLVPVPPPHMDQSCGKVTWQCEPRDTIFIPQQCFPLITETTVAPHGLTFPHSLKTSWARHFGCEITFLSLFFLTFALYSEGNKYLNTL